MTLRSKSTLKVLIFPAILLIIFVILVITRLNGSSIGYFWYTLYSHVNNDPNLLLGIPRFVRSDEFAVNTPWTIMESRIGFDLWNPFIGSGQNLLLVSVPIRHWSLLFSPQNWGYLFLPVDYAFSFQWWFRALVVILGVYMFSTRLLKGNYLISAMISVSAWFSPAIQWWTATSLPEIFGYFFILLSLFMIIIESTSKRTLITCACLLVFFIGCFIFTRYLPAIIPAMIALIFLVVGFLLNKFLKNTKSIQHRTELGTKTELVQEYLRQNHSLFKIITALFLILVIDLAFLALFYAEQKPLIDLVMSSSYPGQRFAEGGTMEANLMLGGFYDLQLIRDIPAEINAPNQSESSSFFMLSLFLLPFFMIQQIRNSFYKKSIDFFIIFSILYFILGLCWAFVGLPEGLARLVMFNRVPPERLLISFGALNLFLIIYYLSQDSDSITNSSRWLIWIWAAIVAVLYYLVGTRFPKFLVSAYSLNPTLATVIPVIILLLLVTLLQKARLAFSGLLLSFSIITSFYINPIYHGISVINETEVAKTVSLLAETPENLNLKWVLYDSDIALPNYFAANGAHVLNATQYHPQPDLWAKFDTRSQFANVYNRYAHIGVTTNSENEISFSIVRPDAILLAIHPCNPVFVRAGVQFFVFHEPVDYACLELVKAVPYPNMSFFIYQREINSTAP